MFKKICKENL